MFYENYTSFAISNMSLKNLTPPIHKDCVCIKIIRKKCPDNGFAEAKYCLHARCNLTNHISMNGTQPYSNNCADCPTWHPEC